MEIEILHADPHSILLNFGGSLYFASYCNEDNKKLPYGVTPVPFFCHKGKIIFGKEGQIHSDMLKMVDVVLAGHIRNCEELTQQGRVFVVNDKGKSIAFITLWAKDYTKDLYNEVIKRYPSCDKYILLIDSMSIEL